MYKQYKCTKQGDKQHGGSLTGKKEKEIMPDARNVIKINAIYLIIYKSSGAPYINEDKTSHAFLRKTEAEAYISEKDELAYEFGEVADGKYYEYEELISLCYSSGAEHIHLYTGAEIMDITIGKLPPLKYYNTRLAGTLNLLLTTKKKKYMYELYKRRFVVPIRIDDGLIINYGIARIKDREFFLVFSNTDEFNIWASHVEGFEPLELTFREIQWLNIEKDIIINITGNRFLLDKGKIDKIIEFANNAEESAKGVSNV